MQEIPSIGGGRSFGGGDRRLRPYSQHNSNNHNNQNHQALRCPRCESLNTKFCYYNNYNLSQLRYFCKSCRRYWTKGGVLRNVPVGGGCRKSKRSKPKNSSSKTSVTPAAAEAPATTSLQPEQELKTFNSHSSSESSSLTAVATEAASAPSSNNSLDNLHKFFVHPYPNPSFEPGVIEQGGGGGGGDSGIFSEIGNLTSLITSSNEALAFGYGSIPDASSFHFTSGCATHPQDLKFAEMSMMTMSGSLLDQTVPVDLSAVESKIGHGGFGPLDWQSSTDQGLFDLPNTVDQAYWTHT